MADLNAILKGAKSIMDKTKDLPHGMLNDKLYEGRNKNTAKPQPSTHKSSTPSLSESIGKLTNTRSVNLSSDYNFNDIDETSFDNSRLPKEVQAVMRESLKDRQKLNMSVTANVDASVINEQRHAPQQVITEQMQQPMQVTNSNVDYSLIKVIVEDCIKKQMGSLKKTLLAEGNRMELPETMVQQGNTFRFVTTDGKIFEGKLTYKGNINDK